MNSPIEKGATDTVTNAISYIMVIPPPSFHSFLASIP